MATQARVTYRPRNDFVLVELDRVGPVNKISLPDAHPDAKKFIVRAVGEEVQDLVEGDVIMICASPGEGSLFPLPAWMGPNAKKMGIVKEKFCGMIYEEEEILEEESIVPPEEKDNDYGKYQDSAHGR